MNSPLKRANSWITECEEFILSDWSPPDNLIQSERANLRVYSPGLVTTRQSHPVWARKFVNHGMWRVYSPGLVTTRQSHPVRAREFLNNGMWGVYSPGLVTTRQSHPVRAREFLNNRMWGVLSPGLVTGLVMIMMMTIANFFVQSHVHGKRAGDECPSWQTGGSKVISRNQDKNKDNDKYVYFVWPIITTIKV